MRNLLLPEYASICFVSSAVRKAAASMLCTVLRAGDSRGSSIKARPRIAQDAYQKIIQVVSDSTGQNTQALQLGVLHLSLKFFAFLHGQPEAFARLAGAR